MPTDPEVLHAIRESGGADENRAHAHLQCIWPYAPSTCPSLLTSRPAARDLLSQHEVKLSILAVPSIAILFRLPVRRDVAPRKKDLPFPKLSYKLRVVSFLIQATGVEARRGCNRCSRGNGPWDCCVVTQGPEGAQLSKGACANCCWGHPNLCSFCTSPSSPPVSLTSS